MKKIEVTKYIAEDGKEFDTESECFYYENEVLKRRQLINCFKIFDGTLKEISKPKYLWTDNLDNLQAELEQSPIYKEYDFCTIQEDAEYLVFMYVTDDQYQIIRRCFVALGVYLDMDFVLPDKLEETEVVYWNGGSWDNFDREIKSAQETLENYKTLKFAKLEEE